MESLLTLSTGLPLAALCAIALPFLLWFTYSRITFGLLLVLATFFMEVVYVEFPGYWVGIYLYPGDLVFTFLSAVAVARAAFAKDVPGRSTVWLLFGAVIALSFVLGLQHFGKAAGTDFRNYFYVWTTVLYFSSFRLDEARVTQIIKTWLFFTALLLGLALLRWVAEYLNLPIVSSWRGTGPEADYRVVPSNAALFFVDSFLILTYILTTRAAKRWVWLSVPVLLAAIVVLQHRSVWIAAAAGLVAMYVAFPGRVRKQLAQYSVAAAFLVGAPAVVLTAYGKLDTLMNAVSTSVASATDLERGTAGGRIYGWKQLLSQMAPADYVIGKPFGSGYERYEFPNVRWKATWDPHNFYIQTLLRGGLIGLGLLLAVYFFTMRRLLSDTDVSGKLFLPPRLMFVLLVTQLAYMAAYRFAYEQAIWLGLAISIVAAMRKLSREAAKRKLSLAVRGRSGPAVGLPNRLARR
ncbi:MAG: O-antigen ligase family protein [Burkholderiales bacterium]|nr:O-antigen ligase family protein [Burkholderiales bacterium]